MLILLEMKWCVLYQIVSGDLEGDSQEAISRELLAKRKNWCAKFAEGEAEPQKRKGQASIGVGWV